MHIEGMSSGEPVKWQQHVCAAIGQQTEGMSSGAACMRGQQTDGVSSGEVEACTMHGLPDGGLHASTVYITRLS